MPPESPAHVPHMPADAFRHVGTQLLDLIARYSTGIESRPVFGPVQPGDLLRDLPEHPPERGISSIAPSPDSWPAVLADVENLILPRLNHWQHPSFFGFFPANGSNPAILGELLAAGLATPAFLWITNPAATELEIRMVDWLGEAMGLPEAWLVRSGVGGGVIHTTASEASLTALVTARHRARARAMARPGWDPARFHPTIYTSTQAHSSIVKAAMVAGLAHGPEDRTHVRLIDVDQNLAMDPQSLAEALRADLSSGRTPIYVGATVGTTSSTAIDPLGPIAKAVRESGATDAWIHIDAAHAGVAAICPEFRAMFDGLDRCDSLCVNPHKWLLTNFDCDVFYVRDRRPLIDAMSITPAYLRNAASDSGQVIDYRDWQVPLGRRFRALKLWFVFRHYGLEGLRAHVRTGMAQARVLEDLVRADEAFEIAAPRTMNLVCFRLKPRSGESPADTDARNKRLADAVNASGRLYLTPTILPTPGREASGEALPPRFVLRMAIGGTATEERHVRAAWEAIIEIADALGE